MLFIHAGSKTNYSRNYKSLSTLLWQFNVYLLESVCKREVTKLTHMWFSLIIRFFLVSCDHKASVGGTWWCSWLRHCNSRQKVAGSIPDGVIWIFHWCNPSGFTKAMGSNKPLTAMGTRNISWGVQQPVLGADNLTTFMCWLSWNCRSFNLLQPSVPVTLDNKIIFTFSHTNYSR